MSANSKWTAGDVPDQTGRVAIITGANTGLGYETAAVLADHGAHVVLAVRNLDKGKDAVARIKAETPTADVTLQALDLTSLDDIRKASDELRSAYPRIDLLINNAGVMYTDKGNTKDGFELQFGTNHLGHYALTGHLLDNLLPVDGSRVVTVSSVGHKILADIHFDDLQWDRSYNRVRAYGQAKLANLLFTYELARRLAAKGASDHRAGGTPRRVDHRTEPQHPAGHSPCHRLRLGAVCPECGDGRAPDAARRDRPAASRAGSTTARRLRRGPRTPQSR